MRFRSLSVLFAFLLPAAWCGDVAGQPSAEWQQRVRYEMDIRLLADRHLMEGAQRLTYENHSPDTLHRVFYHLYFNAFDPASMMAFRNRDLPDPDNRVVPRIFELGPDEVGYHRIRSLKQDGRPVTYRVTDTLLEVELAEPIPPGRTAVFAMTFDSQVPLQTRRSGRDNREGIDYSMAQWYPKLAAYDERGWHADPYVGREFYAPFGTFDVRITLPAHYVVGGTGVLQNPDEIGHGYQADTTRVYTYDPADSLTWHFVAENVHDFAWAADPDYVHDRFTDDRGTTYHLLYQPDVADAWSILHVGAPRIIQFFSDHIGPYAYPQFTVAQAGDGGMEYPMVNFITGRRSPYSVLGVTAHEAAHEWFYAMLASNEANYAWMDEGFTSFWSGRAMAHLLGQPAANHQGSLLNIRMLHEYGLYEHLNTPSDWFRTNLAYGVAAYSGGTMIAEMMGYVLSDSLRDAFFREYYDRFRFRHPDPYDVEKVAEDVSGLRLDWFFEQFLETEWSLDYAVEGLRSERTGDGWRTTVVLEREDDIAMPVDLRLTLADGATQWVNVPLAIMAGHKPVPPGWVVAEPWAWTAPRYTLVLDLPRRVVGAEIDPLNRTPERTRLNNSARFPLEAAFLRAPAPSWDHYSVGWRPLVLYADDFGVGAGLQARGTYLFGDHEARAMLTLWPQLLASGGDEPDLDPAGWRPDAETSFFDGIDYELAYERDVPALGAFASAELRARKHLGFMENTVSFSRPFGRFVPLANPERRLTVSLLHQYTPTDRVFTIDRAPLFHDLHLVSARLAYRIADGADHVEVGAEVGGALEKTSNCLDMQGGTIWCGTYAQPGATHAYIEGVKTAALGGLLGRAHVMAGVGVDDMARHKQFRLGAAPAEAAWRNDAFRTISATMDDALADAHLAAIGAPGPVAYLLAEDRGGTPMGTRMLAGTLSLGTGPLARRGWLHPLRLEAFSGAGLAGYTTPVRVWSSGLLADAGVGLTYDVGDLPFLQRWAAQSDVLSGLRLALKLPVWASDPAYISPDEDAFAFRWLVGISTGE